jgi:hypothetical protein
MRAFCAYILYLIWYLYFRYRHRGSVQNRSWNNEIWKVYMPTYFVLHATDHDSRPSRYATVTLTRPERVWCDSRRGLVSIGVGSRRSRRALERWPRHMHSTYAVDAPQVLTHT